jgi:CheY-like chemotaxis protein
MGIKPELLPHIFGLFTQGERSLARSEGGLGIGLTLVKKLVDLHGGEVTAISQGADQGSEFVVKLPTLNKVSTKTEPEHLLEINTKTEQGLRILMIDDNADVLDSLSLWLEMEGHLVKTASNGKMGISIAQDFAPDIILLDIGMPDMDGYQVAVKLRELPCLQKTKIVAMSGYGRREELKMDTADFDHYLIKPPKLNEIQSLISEYQRAKTGDGKLF